MDDMSVMMSSRSPVAEFLTPRTKVAKMLAEIDEEIDNAPTPSPSKGPPGMGMDKDSAIITTSISPVNVGHVQSSLVPTYSDAERRDVDSPSDTDESEDMVRRPQGRAARRMLGKAEHTTRKSSPPVNISSSPQQPASTIQDDEDDLYSATPMKQPRRARTASPSPVASARGSGLFVSPSKSVDADSESELPSHPLGGQDKLAELVAQKRAERMAKEAEEKERRRNASNANTSSDLPDEAFEGPQEPVDPNIERIMSDATRPSRKASKKALLDMERETQRMARQQALAHQMKVKKKFTTNDLFAKFNFRQSNEIADIQTDQPLEGDTTASSVPNSDGAEERSKDPPSTPPSSPPTPLDRQTALVEQGALSKLVAVRQDSIASLVDIDDDEELPDITEVIKASQVAKATPASQTEEVSQVRKGLKIARLGKKAVPQYESSDDELDIVPSLPPHLRAFERVASSKQSNKSGESRAIHNLKHLSNIHAGDGPRHKKGSKPSISAKALEYQLRQQAKEQARKQQLERIEELKAKGIDVQTTEEREKEAEAFENLLEKARQDAVELRKAEKAARKGADGEDAMQVSDDDNEDEDYNGSESEDGDVEDGDDEQARDDDGLLDEAAEETDDEGEDIEGSDEEPEVDDEIEEDQDETATTANSEDMGKDLEAVQTSAIGARKSRKSRIIRDDEDEVDSETEQPHQPEESEPDEDPFAAFDFGAVGNVDFLLSPTQAFHATMETPTQATQEDSFDILRHIAPPSASSLPPSLPDIETQDEEESQLSFVAGSQVPESQRINLNWETQPPETPGPANLNREISGLSETPGWEPSQDAGLPSPWSIGLRRGSTMDSVDEHDTQSTVLMRVSESPVPSQTAPRRGRLVRREAAVEDDSEDDDLVPPTSIRPEKKDAFREMARRRKEALTAAERTEAEKEMREMMDEQAEESEDEYTGLGGDDFVAPETEEDKEMIDSSHVEVDERALAAHFAERERIRNEEETSRLYKDLTTGVLRRKMGANAFDLEEDEDELAARRRQMRQQEEARKRKALLKDVNIATLADGRQSRGKDAFLKAIADDDGDEDIINISDGEDASVPATQDEIQPSQSQQSAHEPLRETSGNKRKMAEDEDGREDRATKQRRTQISAFKRPTSLLEVKESVSFLLEEPHVGPGFGPTTLELSSDSESEEEDDRQFEESDDDEIITAEEARQNDGGFAPNPASMDAKIMPPPRLPASQRRTAPKPAVVDRLSLKRGSSASDSAHGRTAWAAGPTTGGFKVPSLLRRATTNIASGANDRGVTTPTLSRENSSVKMGGTKKSSLAYQARAEERKAIVEASAKRREENTARIAQLRRNSSALNRGLTGRFE